MGDPNTSSAPGPITSPQQDSNVAQALIKIADRPHHWTMFVSLFAIVASGASAFMAWRSSEFASKQYELAQQVRNDTKTTTEKQLKEAETARFQNAKNSEEDRQQSRRALDASIEISRYDQRAWVAVRATSVAAGSLQVGKRPTVHLELANSGKSPATRLTVAGTAFVRQTLTEKDIDLKFPSGPRTSVALLAPATSYIAELDSTEAFSTSQQLEFLTQRKSWLYAVGTVYYEDVFKRPWKTHFCFRFEPQTQGSRFGGIPCAEHNGVE